jgi:hypothetical protein
MYRFQKNPKILNPKIPQTVESILAEKAFTLADLAQEIALASATRYEQSALQFMSQELERMAMELCALSVRSLAAIAGGRN